MQDRDPVASGALCTGRQGVHPGHAAVAFLRPPWRSAPSRRSGSPALGMPAVMIRNARGVGRGGPRPTSEGQRRVLLEQVAMINRACERSVPEASDRADIQRRYEAILTMESRMTESVRDA